jgi:hypothetical protein
MAGAAPLLWMAAALGVAGVAALRFAWSLARRSAVWNGIGWGLLALSAVAAGQTEGAWGVAVAALFAMGAATVLLAAAAVRSPRGRAAASNRRVGLLPEGAEPRRIGRRFGTFALVILAGFAAAVSLAMGVRGLAGLLGWSEANANALALFATPLTWAVLVTGLLMQTRRRSQFTTLALCYLPVLPVLLSGALS